MDVAFELIEPLRYKLSLDSSTLVTKLFGTRKLTLREGRIGKVVRDSKLKSKCGSSVFTGSSSESEATHQSQPRLCEGNVYPRIGLNLSTPIFMLLECLALCLDLTKKCIRNVKKSSELDE